MPEKIQVFPEPYKSSGSSTASCDLFSAVPGLQLKWTLPLRNPTAHWFVKAAVMAVVMGSAINLAWSALLFGWVLQPPGHEFAEFKEDELPRSGYISWTACNCSLDANVTALGAELSLDYVRAVVSIATVVAMGAGQVFMCSAVVSGCRRTWLAAVVQLLLVTTAVGAILAGVDAFVVELCSQVGLSTWIFACIMFLEPQAEPTTCGGSRALFGSVLLSLVSIVGLEALVATRINAVLAYGGALLLHKAVEVLMRVVLKQKQMAFLPPEACAFVLLGHQASGQISMRRHTLGLETATDVALAGLLQCLVEVVQAGCGTAAMVWLFNKTVETNPHQALRVLKVSTYGVLADLVCEHVAMQTAVGYSLFMDERVWALALSKGPGEVVGRSAIFVAFELLSDGVVLALLLGFLPQSSGLLNLSLEPGPELKLQLSAVFACLCLWMCTTGLSALASEEAFSCRTVCSA